MAQDADAAPPTPPSLPDVPPGAFILGPRLVAYISALLAVGCVAALVLVATAHDADALATIALALAILAFAAQLIIYIAQVASANQQLFLAQQVQRETASLLRGIEASAAVTQALFSDQYERVIDRLVNTTVDAKTPAEAGDQPEVDREALLAQLRDVVREEVAASRPLTITSLDPATGNWGYNLTSAPVYTGSVSPFLNRYGAFSSPYEAAADLKRRHDEGERRSPVIDLDDKPEAGEPRSTPSEESDAP